MTVIDEQGRVLARSLPGKRNRAHQRPRARRLVCGNFISAGAMMFRADLTERILPFPDHVGVQDWWIALQAARVVRSSRSRGRCIATACTVGTSTWAGRSSPSAPGARGAAAALAPPDDRGIAGGRPDAARSARSRQIGQVASSPSGPRAWSSTMRRSRRLARGDGRGERSARSRVMSRQRCAASQWRSRTTRPGRSRGGCSGSCSRCTRKPLKLERERPNTRP